MKLSQRILLFILTVILIIGTLFTIINIRGTNERANLQKEMTNNEKVYRKYNEEYSDMASIQSYAKTYEMNMVGRILDLLEYYPLYKPENFTNPDALGEYIDSELLAEKLGVSYEDSVNFLKEADSARDVKITAENSISSTIVNVDYYFNAEKHLLYQEFKVSQPAREFVKRVILVYNDAGYVEEWIE